MNEQFMRAAIAAAQKAADMGEVPVGAVVVKNGQIIAVGFNRRESAKNALSHAETEAINNACTALGSWRLEGCDLYVTLEPCPMCAGAILNARISNVYFGAYDAKNGCCGSVCDLFSLPFTHKANAVGGFLADECGALLSEFFKNLRQKG
ncbi:MAG: nucleoside deaminase [Oscillospiraceae bacterium]|nr:nucleoside deaminase [Oscillospiraceae bacterium]